MARARSSLDLCKDAPPDTPVHYDSKLDKFDQRREILCRQYAQNPQELRKALKAVKHVSLYEFWWKFSCHRGKFVKTEGTSALMVTPSYGADCANVQHSAHSGYAKACVIAYWRLMPTKARHDLYHKQRILPAAESSCSDMILGGTEFVDPFHRPGPQDKDRFLGVQDLYVKFEGRDYGQQHVDGWALALLEMLVDPVLVSWVPKWVREQYERSNPYFRRVLEKMTGEHCRSNHRFLLRLCRKMVWRHEQSVLRKSREGKDVAEDGSSSSSDGADEGPGGESECEEGIGNELRLGQEDDAGDDEARRVPIVHEPRPSAGEEADEGVEERDWSRAGVEERLSSAGAAPVTADRSAGAARLGSAGLSGYGSKLYNPQDYPYADNSVVHRREHRRLEALLESWKGQAVADGANAVARDALDPWQKFAHDIVSRRDRVLSQKPVRCFMIGTAGTGKSRTVRSFVGVKRSIVKSKLEGHYDSRQLQSLKVKNLIADAVRFCCQLGAPTGCASFQLKFGASTLHRLFGVPIGYCGPAANRNTERFRIKKDRMRLAQLYVLDEMSMIGRRMLGKIEFKLRDHLGNVPSSDGSEPVMGQKDYILCGDPKQCPPIGDEPIYQDGEYIGKAENKPRDAQDIPPGAFPAKKLVKLGLAIRDACEDVVILRKVHRLQVTDDTLPPEKRALYAEEAVKFLECTRGMADCTWTPAQRHWLARRNRSVLQQTPEGRAQLERLEKAPLLMDTRVDKATGQVGADRLNEVKLQQLSARTSKPIVALGAHHDKPENQPELKADMLDADNFRGMANLLLMCEEARVLLTDNTWIEPTQALMETVHGPHLHRYPNGPFS